MGGEPATVCGTRLSRILHTWLVRVRRIRWRPYGAGVQTTHAPTAVGTQTPVEPHVPADRRHGPAASSARFSSWRIIELVALVLSVIGAFLPWATADAALAGLFVRESPVSTSSQAGCCAACSPSSSCSACATWLPGAAATAIALLISWLGALALSVYEIVDIIAVPTLGLALDVGVGLYLCGFARLDRLHSAA